MITVLSPGRGAESLNGLPKLDRNESLYHASFRVIAEGNVLIEGVVAALSPLQAGGRLLAAEAQLRGISCEDLLRMSSYPEARWVTDAEAFLLIQRQSPAVELLPVSRPPAREPVMEAELSAPSA